MSNHQKTMGRAQIDLQNNNGASLVAMINPTSPIRHVAAANGS